jgi:hypothetical protein
MHLVAAIAPMGRDYGLVAFLCHECGSADSVLINRADWQRGHQASGQQPAASIGG